MSKLKMDEPIEEATPLTEVIPQAAEVFKFEEKVELWNDGVRVARMPFRLAEIKQVMGQFKLTEVLVKSVDKQDARGGIVTL